MANTDLVDNSVHIKLPAGTHASIVGTEFASDKARSPERKTASSSLGVDIWAGA
jgi:hypothetical protein